MPQKEFVPKGYEIIPSKTSSSGLCLQSHSKGRTFHFTFDAIKPGLFRVTFTSDDHPIPPYPSVVRPPSDLRNVHTTTSDIGLKSKRIDVGDVSALVEWSHTPVVSLSWRASKNYLHRDLPLRSYVVDSTGVAHYTTHDRSALHVGLGEKAAPMDLTNRHFILSTTDCFGYDVYRTDPMYKHIPLLIKATPEGCVAMFSTSHSRGTWSVGSEIDGLWGHFKVYRQDYGGLEEYIVMGKTLQETVRIYAELAGFPLLVPRWAFGYISGGYKYTMMDDPPASQALLEFAAKLKEHDIPCSAHQMSSGYSISHTEPKVRNVFNWNSHRFPQPEKWIAKFHETGMRLLTNIKPFVLTSHPDYQKLVEGGGLFRNPGTEEPGVMRLWSAGGAEGGDGCHVDFSSSFAFKWWYNGVQMLKRAGIDAMWNDNNEYTLPDDDWELALSSPDVKSFNVGNVPNIVGLWGRTMHAELMGKASHDALLELDPRTRPFILTRSATAGTLRYAASSWSGDDVTSWEGMKGANSLSLSAGMCLLQCYGHDIGGFEGPQPSPELLLRWVQLGIYSSRFAINCFKTSPQDNKLGEVIEPWMYPEITPLIRNAIKRRYEMLPYIYSLSLESHLYASPPQRWIGWGYENDPEVWSKKLKQGEEQFWFGDTVLVGGVYEPGVSSTKIYLPRKTTSSDTPDFDYGYVNLNPPYNYLASGQWVDVASDWKTHIPVMARIGGAIPIGKSVPTRSPGEAQQSNAASFLEDDDYRGIEIFPPRSNSHGKVFSTSWLEDDGFSQRPQISRFTIHYSSTEEKITVDLTGRDKSSSYIPAWSSLDVILPHGDKRYVVNGVGKPLLCVGRCPKGRQIYRFKDPSSD